MLCKSYTDIAYSSLIVIFSVASIISIFLILSHPKIEINQKCRFRNGTLGICVKNSNCFVREKFTGFYIGDDCSLSDLTCCLQENILPEGTKDFEFHENFKYFRNKKCGIVAHSGHNPDHHYNAELPWIVSLGHINNNSHLKFTCGGSLISEKFILTSAQCVMPVESSYNLSVIRLRLNKKSRNEEEEHVDLKEFKIIPHPNFDPVNLKNDIALIKLDLTLNLVHYGITPVCLPLEKETKIPYELTSIGLKSKNSKRRSRPSVYQINVKECDRKIKLVNNISNSEVNSRDIKKNLTNLSLNENQLCVEREVMDLNCNGEQGMPLLSQLTMRTNTIWTQYGILSFDYSSCEMPSIYTNVRSHLRWIFDNVDH